MLRRPHAWRSFVRELEPGDRRATYLLVALPILAYVPFSLVSHPILPGDDLFQNYPLRVLVGEVIASGHLPTWDPLIWSGTPLLGGWNAGAMFPGTWLFVFLPGIAAWTVNFAAVPIVSSLGVYVFARRGLFCRPLASLLAALVFTYTGYMMGQIVHLGLEQGSAVIPWMLVGIEGARGARDVRSRTGFVLVIGVAFALNVLAGDPRAISSAVIIALIYLVASMIRARRDALALAVTTLAGGGLGLLLSGVQWLPGIEFLRSSQRQVTAYNYFGAGSISLGHQLLDYTIPLLNGGNHNFGLPIYTGNYNAPEVTIGVGLVALVAAASYLPELTRSAIAWCKGEPGRSSRRLGVWYVLGIVGVVLTLGSTAPTGHVLFHIPLFGAERLQNRNAVLVDLALAMVLAIFIDDLQETAAHRSSDAVTENEGHWGRSALAARLLGLVPSLLVTAAVAAAFLAPDHLERAIDFPFPINQFFDELSPYLISSLVVALALAGVVFFQSRLGSRRLLCVLVGFVVIDIATYALNAGLATTPSAVIASSNPTSRAVAKAIGPNGRFALFNPAYGVPDNDANELTRTGITDVNIVQANPSVQGYGSIVDGTYQEVTGTHAFEYIRVSRLHSETANTLDLSRLLTLPIYLEEQIPSHSAIPVSGGPAVTATGLRGPTIDAPPPPPFAGGPWVIQSGLTQRFFLASPATVVRATVVVSNANVSSLRVLTLGPGLAPRGVTGAVENGQVHVVLGPRSGVTTIVVEDTSPNPVLIGAVVVVTSGPDRRLLLDGELQGGLAAPQWRFDGDLGPYTVFANTETRGFAWLQRQRTHTPETSEVAPGTVRLESNSAVDPQRFLVTSPKPAILVRSETYAPGWTATLTSTSTGARQTLPAFRFGLVQAVTFPAGTYVVTWRYAPRQIVEGVVLSLVGLLALAVLVIFYVARRRRNAAGHERIARAEPGGARG